MSSIKDFVGSKKCTNGNIPSTEAPMDIGSVHRILLELKNAIEKLPEAIRIMLDELEDDQDIDTDVSDGDGSE